MIELTKAVPGHAAIVPYLRQADVAEIWASTGLSPAFAVSYSIAHSKDAWAVLLDGKPQAVFGVGNFGVNSGVPWLVATDEIEKHPVRFYRMSKPMIAILRHKYEHLVNWVDARNKLSLRWLKWAGFTIDDPEPWGIYGLMFHRVWWKR
jgi:hypothetical protein